MNRRSAALCCLPFLGCATLAPSLRSKPLPTLEDLIAQPALVALVATRSHRLGQPAEVQVTPDGRTALYLIAGPRSDLRELRALDLTTGADRLLANAATLLGQTEAAPQLTKEEAAQRERLRLTAGGIGSYELLPDGRGALLPLGGKLFVVELASGRARQLPGAGGAFDPQISPDGQQVAFVREREVWVQPLDGATPGQRLSSGATATLSHGSAEFVAQEEMDRFHGTFWSADSQTVAYQETDEAKVETYYLADPTHGLSPSEGSPYPRPGHPNAAVRLGLVARTGGPTRWVQWDSQRFPYLARVHWASDGSVNVPLVIEVESRDQRELRLLAVDPQSGASRQLWAERDDAWVELTDDFRWLPGVGFLWSSERSGQRTLELHRESGELAGELTAAALGFRHVVAVDPHGPTALVEAGRDATRQQIYAVPLRLAAEGTPPGAVRVEAGDGVALAKGQDDGRPYWLHQASLGAPPTDELRAFDGRRLATLPSRIEPLAPLPAPRFVTLDLPQGKLEAAILLPRGAQAGQRFPVIDWVYGGPTVTTVQRAALAFELQQWFADLGFAVVKIDNRGTPNRGRAFSRAIAGNLAEVPLGDQADALAKLAQLEPALDLEHVGVIGASFGGYLSALAVLARPDRFQAGVALAPVTDWLEYDTHYTERYLGLPASNPRGYTDSSLIERAADLRRPLLLGHGTADDNVHFGHTLALVEALELHGHAPDLFLIPGQTHLFADQTTQRLLWARAARFFLENLR